MKNLYRKSWIVSNLLPVLTMLLLWGHTTVNGQLQLSSLTTEYLHEPLGLDVRQPRFSWQLHSIGDGRGYSQTAYRIKVADERGNQVWDSGKVNSGEALGIVYKGADLAPRTRYTWDLTVWDQDNSEYSTGSWFETALLNADPAASAWNGAEWIGGGGEDLQLYSHYLSVFRLNYGLQLDQASATSHASFIIGANDARLMDKDLNIQGVASGKNEHSISFELDISGLANGRPARINVYRVGYAPGDNATVPFKSFPIPAELINDTNKYQHHTIYIECNFGLFQVHIDGAGESNLVSESDDSSSPFADPGFNINPVGSGNNYISFPMLADIGFRMDPGQKAVFRAIEVRHFREPSNVIFGESPDSAEGYEGIYAEAVQDIDSGLRIGDKGFMLDGAENGILLTADPSRKATPMLRTVFNTENKKITRARIYATARGIYEVHVNGERVGDSYFTPGLTQYNKTHQYQVYDVTDRLQPGADNVLGAWLSEGWWSGNITYSGENWNFFGDRPSLRSMLVVTYVDGTEQVVVSKAPDWKLFTEGPLRYGSFFQGEVYDATREDTIEGWATAGYDDSGWKEAVEVPLEGTTYQDDNQRYDTLELIAQIGNSPGIVKTLEAQSVEEVRDGVFVYDMGQNMVGFPQIHVGDGVAGDTLIVRYAEVRYPDLPDYDGQVGMIMLENIRAALTQDLYILKGGDEVIQPRFTFHGYRFLELSGIKEPPGLADVKGQVVSSIDDLASHYETSNDLVNKLWENITWSLRGNFLSIPTDTPARNERMGWSGDINVFSEAATYLADADPFLTRHLIAMRDIQREDGRFTDVAPVGGGFGGTLWGSAGMVIPWQLYLQYGDKRALEDHYDAMKRYMAFLDSKTDPATGRLEEGPLGDWLSPEGSRNDNTLFWVAYQVHDLDIMAKAADILGKEEEAAAYREKYNERKDYFNRTYVDPATSKTVHSGFEGRLFGPPPPGYKQPEAGIPIDTQASYAIPLHFHVFDESHIANAANHLEAAVARENMDDLGVVRPEYSLMTGFIGTASLSKALSEYGKDETAYTLLQQETYPSWLYSVINGATTIWERLNSYTIEDGFGGNNSMNSFNHYSFGAVVAWMYNHCLGIQRDEEHPGFKHFYLEPLPDPTGRMKWARGYYDSPYGRIESSWEVKEGSTAYSFTVPPNTTARLFLPAEDVKKITKGGKRVSKVKSINLTGGENGKYGMELVSGTHSFEVEH